MSDHYEEPIEGTVEDAPQTESTEIVDPFADVRDLTPEEYQTPTVQVLRIGYKLYVESSVGRLIIPLVVKTKLFRAMGSQATEADQLIYLVDGLGDKELSTKLDDLDSPEFFDLVGKYFDAFSDYHKASPGESQRSSN